MKFFGRSTKIAGSLAAALMISAPLALAATPTFAADYHSDRHDGDRNRGDNDRHDGDRSNYRGGEHRGYRHNDHRGMRYERMAFRHHGHWGYSHGHRMWIVAFHGR